MARPRPQSAVAHHDRGVELIAVGDLAEARRCLERAVELAPRNGGFYLSLVTAATTAVTPAHVNAMCELARDIDTLPRAQQIGLHFALGNVYERAGRIDESFHHYGAGNALKRAELAYDEAAALAYIRSLDVAFGNPMMEALRGCGDRSERPIFIVGMPRSGSTLVEQLLSAHAEVASAGESDTLGSIVRAVWPAMTARSIEALRAQVRTIGERYLRATDAAAAGKARLTDKTLEHTQLLPLIHVTLPNARIIHIRRDDLDTCFSCFATLFSGAKVPFAYDLGELGRYDRGYREMMARWRRFVSPERLLEVDYERLVEDFEAQARRILAFCGLAWDPAVLRFHDARRTVRTASNVQVRQPLYRTSVGRARPFERHLTPLSDALSTPDRRNIDA